MLSVAILGYVALWIVGFIISVILIYSGVNILDSSSFTLSTSLLTFAIFFLVVFVFFNKYNFTSIESVLTAYFASWFSLLMVIGKLSRISQVQIVLSLFLPWQYLVAAFLAYVACLLSRRKYR